MKKALEDFLDRNLPLPGVAACSARLADRSFVSRCYGDWFTTAQVEQALIRLALAADSLGYHGIQPTRLCWVFERTRIYLALHRDAVCLAFFVENRPGDPNPKLQALLEEFAAMSAERPVMGT
jgi:hypothetical protein